MPSSGLVTEAVSHPAIVDTARAKTELGWMPRETALEAVRETFRQARRMRLRHPDEAVREVTARSLVEAAFGALARPGRFGPKKDLRKSGASSRLGPD